MPRKALGRPATNHAAGSGSNAAREYYETEHVRQAARGAWTDIISSLCGLDRDTLNPHRHGPCPKCGGTDRFRVFDNFSETGGMYCNQCFNSKNGDGFAALQWLMHDVKFLDAVAYVARFVGVKPTTGDAPSNSPTADPAERLDFQPWNAGSDNLAWLWTLAKPPITVPAIQAIGGKLAKFRNHHHVIAFPVLNEQNKTDGWAVYQTNNKPLPTGWDKVAQKFTEEKKMLLTTGSKPGLIGEVLELDNPQRKSATVVVAEGTPDLLALLSIIPGAPSDPAASPGQLSRRSDYILLTNSNGANQKPLPWIVKKLAGRRVIILRDADKPGELGATRWVAGLVESASEVRNPKLPYAIAEEHGPDLRDWINEGHNFADFEAWVNSAAPIDKAEAIAAAAGDSPEEAEDDPHRLAKLYLERNSWHKDHGKTLRLWREEWWRWTGKKYQQIPEDEIRADVTNAVKIEFDRCCKLAIEKYELWCKSPEYNRQEDKGIPKPRKVTQNLVNNTLGALRGMVILPASIDRMSWIGADGEIKSGCSFIALQNGILDVDKLLAQDPGCLVPHTPEWFSPICLPYDFNPAAECPKWGEFMLKNLEEDPERIYLLQEWAGYLLTPDTDQQKFVVFEGEGSNGKSVFCAAIRAMLGNENVSSVGLEFFGERFHLGTTLGKLANIVTDCGELDKVAEGYLKQYTSGDSMFFDRKGISGFSAVPTARVMLATNNRPRFTDRSNGLWRRMILVPWRVQIQEGEKVKGMDKDWWWIKSGELPGIFRWALGGLRRLREQKRFTESELCNTALEDYRIESNPAREFLVDNCETNEFFSVMTQDLYAAYKKWCNEHGYHPLGEKMFGREVARIFPMAIRKRTRDDGILKYEYAGIGIKTETLT